MLFVHKLMKNFLYIFSIEFQEKKNKKENKKILINIIDIFYNSFEKIIFVLRKNIFYIPISNFYGLKFF